MIPADYIIEKLDPVTYRGREEIDGVFAPRKLGDVVESVLDSAAHALELAPACESPIELDFGSALRQILGDRLIVKPQYQLGRFRYDFSVWRPDASRPFALIECDSRQFHQTEAQLANDLNKDRAAYVAGLAIFRVRGGAIWRDHFKAAKSISELLLSVP